MAIEKKTLLVLGLGKLGGPVVDMLAIRHPEHRFVVVCRELQRSQYRANLSRYIAAQWGSYPEIVGDEVDLMSVDRSADLVSRHRPDVVFNATTPFPWWKLDQLPDRERSLAKDAGPGMWCALDCVLPMMLTNAMGDAKAAACHVNGCYPDMTNTFLSDQECAPRIGVGNISNLVPGLQLAFSIKLMVRPADVTIRIIGHHFVSFHAPTINGCPDAPYELAVSYPGGCLRFSGPSDEPFDLLRRQVPRVRHLGGMGVTVGSVATVLDELLGGKKRLHHCPGAKGLPGGYPTRLTKAGQVVLDLPRDLDEGMARLVNEKAQVHDGVMAVNPGQVQATPAAEEAYSEIVGTELPIITRSNAVDVARDAISRLEHRFRLGLVAI